MSFVFILFGAGLTDTQRRKVPLQEDMEGDANQGSTPNIPADEDKVVPAVASVVYVFVTVILRNSPDVLLQQLLSFEGSCWDKSTSLNHDLYFHSKQHDLRVW